MAKLGVRRQKKTAKSIAALPKDVAETSKSAVETHVFASRPQTPSVRDSDAESSYSQSSAPEQISGKRSRREWDEDEGMSEDEFEDFAPPDRPLDSSSDESDDDKDDDDANETETVATGANARKRQNKHAPAIQSSKKQVSRLRAVEIDPEFKKRKGRDPRFDGLSGTLDNHFTMSYNPKEKMEADLQVLKQSIKDQELKIKRTRAMPGLTKGERKEQIRQEEDSQNSMKTEMERLRCKIYALGEKQNEQAVISKLKKEAPSNWHVPKKEIRRSVLEDRFNRLRESKGEAGVKKAVEKKRKKVEGKEKKQLPMRR